MKISVIVPLYNHENYIVEALTSLYNQTFKDFEIILVDDGSTDDSFEKATSFITTIKDPIPTLMIQHKGNKGIAQVRNTGIKQARGELIAFLSSDDIWKPNFLERMIPHVGKGIAFCDYSLISKNSTMIRPETAFNFDKPHTFDKKYFATLVNNAARNNGMFINYSCIIGKKEFFKGKYEFWEELALGEDLYHILKTCAHVNYTYVPEQLVYYRWHDGSTTTKNQSQLHTNNKKIFKKLEEEGLQ